MAGEAAAPVAVLLVAAVAAALPAQADAAVPAALSAQAHPGAAAGSLKPLNHAFSGYATTIFEVGSSIGIGSSRHGGHGNRRGRGRTVCLSTYLCR